LRHSPLGERNGNKGFFYERIRRVESTRREISSGEA
jgi:hypothetical protein